MALSFSFLLFLSLSLSICRSSRERLLSVLLAAISVAAIAAAAAAVWLCVVGCGVDSRRWQSDAAEVEQSAHAPRSQYVDRTRAELFNLMK